MDYWASELEVWVSGSSGVGYIGVAAPHYRLNVGDQITLQSAADLGLADGRFGERALAFLTLVVLDGHHLIDRSMRAGREMPQRLRFAEQLGMTERGFRKFLERTLRHTPGRILRWDRRDLRGWEPSRTGGPWWLNVRSAVVKPSVAAALQYIGRQRDATLHRRRDPSDLLGEAQLVQSRGDWKEALVLLEGAAEMFRTRRWRRDDPLWFEILLALGGTQMQLGEHGLWPRVPVNIRISITEQGLHGPDIDLIRARAHYLAAMIHSQRADRASAQAVLRELQPCRELLAGRPGESEAREYWRARSYEETIRARSTGIAEPKSSSAILEAASVIEERREQERMRYGETLLHANDPRLALDYIHGALASGQLELPAQIIATRLEAIARWMLGAKTARTLDELDEIAKRARSFGFAHQLRLIREHKRRVRRGVRSLILE